MVYSKTKLEKALLLLLVFLFSFGVAGAEKFFVLAMLGVLLIDTFTMYQGVLRIEVDNQMIYLVLWGIGYTFMAILQGSGVIKSAVYFLIGPMVLCEVYRRIVSDCQTDKQWLKAILLPAFGLFLHAVLNIAFSKKLGYFAHSHEHVYDIWTGSFNNRTIIGLYLAPLSVLCIPLALVGKGVISNPVRVCLAVCALLSLGVTAEMGNRTLLVIMFIIFAVCFFVLLKDSRHKLQIIASLLLAVTVIALLYSYDVFGMQTFIKNSYVFRRMSASGLHTSRFGVYLDTLKQFPAFIFGGLSARYFEAGLGLSYAHNIWIDIFIYAGFIPCVLFVLYTITILRYAYRTIQCAETMCMKYVTIAFTLGIFLNWAVEPVLEADPYYFADCCGLFTVFNSYAKRHAEPKPIMTAPYR